MPKELPFPWVFHRDEVDLLEEDMDEFFRLFDVLSDKAHDSELRVLKELEETEEQAEMELSNQMDVAMFIESANASEWNIHTSESEDDFEQHHATRPPLYEEVFLFTKEVFDFADRLYHEDTEDRECAFRICVNAKSVPIKLANAISEETQMGRLSAEVAKKEYGLAIVFLDRVLISLAYLAAQGDDLARSFLPAGTVLLQQLKQQRTRLDNGSRRFPYES